MGTSSCHVNAKMCHHDPQGFRWLEATKIRDAMAVRLTFVVAALLAALPSRAAVQPFPAGFRTQVIDTNGTKYHVRSGGSGPAVLMLHGFGDTGDMWAP